MASQTRHENLKLIDDRSIDRAQLDRLTATSTNHVQVFKNSEGISEGIHCPTTCMIGVVERSNMKVSVICPVATCKSHSLRWCLRSESRVYPFQFLSFNFNVFHPPDNKQRVPRFDPCPRRSRSNRDAAEAGGWRTHTR